MDLSIPKKIHYILLILVTTLSVEALETGYYRSNPLGMSLETISPDRLGEFPYILSVTKEKDWEVRVLRSKEGEVGRWELEFDRQGRKTGERYYRQGQLEMEIEFIDGEVSVERRFEDGELGETRAYSYEGKDLLGVSVIDNEGSLLYREIYRRAAQGRLRRLARVYEDRRTESAFAYSEGRLYEEWHGDDDGGKLFRYGSMGKIAEEVWEGTELVSVEDYVYGEDHTRSQHREEDNQVDRLYDVEGRLLKEETREGDSRSSLNSFLYDGDLLVEKTQLTKSLKEIWRYSYSEDGERLLREEYLQNGKIVTVISYTGEKSYHEEVYRNGKPALRLHFEDGQKVREEVLDLQRGD